MRRFQDKIAVVTGAASGIGRATALRLGTEGAKVVLADRHAADAVGEEIQEQGGEALSVETDVRDETAVEALYKACDGQFGLLDVLVCCAGISFRRPLADTSLDDWQDLVDVNLKGVFLSCRGAIPRMAARNGGAIVTIASELGLVASNRLAAYGATKAGVIQLTRGIAADHAAEGIRANCVCPGPVDTAMLRGGHGSPEESKAAVASSAALTLMGRLGEPREIANVIAFLASDEASFMTGSVVVVDGGLTAV